MAAMSGFSSYEDCLFKSLKQKQAAAPADLAEPKIGFRPLYSKVPPVQQNKMFCVGFCDYVLNLRSQFLQVLNLVLEKLNDPSPLGLMECLRVRLM